MTVTITIDDAAVPAFNAYLETQVTVNLDPITHQAVTTHHFTGIEDFVQKQISAAATYVSTNF